MVKKKVEDGTHEAAPPAMAVVTLARAEEAASRSPVMERAPQSSVAEPQEEAAFVAQ